MGKIYFLVISLIITFISQAQDYPGEMPELLLNRQLKVKTNENSQKYGYRDFYIAPTMRSGQEYKKSTTYTTPYEELAGKVFTVTNVESVGSEKYPSFRLTLQNADLPQLYFQYNPQYDTNYNFEVIGGLKLPDDFYCKGFIPASGNGILSPVSEGITLTKSEEDGTTFYFMHTRVIGDKAEVYKKGAVVQLKNGKVIKKPEAKIEVEVGSTGNYLYTTIFNLTAAEMMLITQSEITQVTLYTFTKKIEKGFYIKEYAKCMIK